MIKAAPTTVVVKLMKHDENLSSGGFVLSKNPTEVLRGEVVDVGYDTSVSWVYPGDVVYFKQGYQIVEDGIDYVIVDAMELIARNAREKEE